MAAAVLNNLTTRCGAGNKDRVVLTGVTNASFSGGVNTTTEGVVNIFEYTGTLTVTDHKAVLEIDRPAGDKPGKVRLHAEVSEDGTVLVRETPR